jgi:hypothetical protein
VPPIASKLCNRQRAAVQGANSPRLGSGVVNEIDIKASVMQKLADETARTYFRDEFRRAREAALKDAEDFDEVLFVLERFGAFLQDGIGALGKYAPYIAVAARISPLAEVVPEVWPVAHTSFAAVYESVRDARNDAMHQGAYARHLTEHALELTIVLEDALMSYNHTISQFMVRTPVCACMWQPISLIRQTMLLNSYSFLPVELTPKLESKLQVDGPLNNHRWRLVSDCLLAQYLRNDVSDNLRQKRLMTTLEKAVESDEIKLLSVRRLGACDPLGKIFENHDHLPVLVSNRCEEKSTEELVGILTPFDML